MASLKFELHKRALDSSEFPLAYLVANEGFLILVLKQRRDESWLARHAWLAEWRPHGFEGVWLCFHPSAGRKVFSKDWVRLAGPERLQRGDGLWYAPDSFLQVLPDLHRESLDAAEEFLNPDLGDLVVDLYSGIGASLARWRARGAQCVGVEIGASAVECAEQNAGPGLSLRGDCVNRLPQVSERVRRWRSEVGEGSHSSELLEGIRSNQPLKTNRALLYVNPPRTGLESEVLDWVSREFLPDRVAYLSCSAGTLARDLRQLTAAGYRVDQVIPYDFFPQTAHVESLALLSRGLFS